ncbi:hypothetical protein [Larkinella soli]|uniref:hypothetical protein n=1 Tax=Larkinella soli TaxID=1770527 RepID=UPI000FFB8FC6|nr:hypothetical protein [Larkinella soli]
MENQIANNRLISSIYDLFFGRRWKVKTSFLCCFLCLLLNNPDYYSFCSHTSFHPEFKDFEYNWTALYQQIQDPFSVHLHKITSHQSKRTFRLTPIFLGKISPFKTALGKIITLFAIQHLLGLLFFYLFAHLIYSITKDALFSFLCTLGTSLFYLGNAFFWDTYGWFDGFAYFLLLAGMIGIVNKKYFLTFILLSFAYWTDERAIIISPCLLLWDLMYHYNFPQNKDSIKISPFAILYPFSLMIYISARQFLSFTYDMHTPMGFNALVGPKMILINMQAMPFSLIGVFEGYWIFIIRLGFLLFKDRNLKLLLTLGIIFSASTIISYCVIDVTRSMTYTFPLLIIAMFWCYKSRGSENLNKLSFLATCVSFIVPDLFFLGKSPVVMFNYFQLKTLLGGLFS